MSKKEMTRQEIETMLEQKYLNRVIAISIPWLIPATKKNSVLIDLHEVTGKVDRISVEITAKQPEPMVVFVINHERHTADVNYFIEKAKLYGNPRSPVGGRTGV